MHGQAALAAHKNKVHGITSPGAMFRDCPGKMEFWTPARLWMHIRKRQQRWRLFEASDPHVMPTRAQNPSVASQPACRIPRPRMWWAELTVLPPAARELDSVDESNIAEQLAQAWKGLQSNRDQSADWGQRSVASFHADPVAVGCSRGCVNQRAMPSRLRSYCEGLSRNIHLLRRF